MSHPTTTPRSLTATAPNSRLARIASAALVTAVAAAAGSAGAGPASAASFVGGSTRVAVAAGATPAAYAVSARRLLVGARSGDISFSAMTSLLGPVKVTRTFYSGALPRTFSTQGISSGVKIIVSYKTPSANTAAYVRSIPTGVNVELAFHHEPEGPKDYAGTAQVGGATFVKAFNAEADTIHRANPRMRVAFIGGGYQYKGGHGGTRGLGGYFIPSHANDFYLDSYQRTTMVPAAKDSSVQNFIHELARKGHQFNGFTEYGRGVIAAGTHFSAAVASSRAGVIKADAAYMSTLKTVDTWSYWYTTDLASGDQWRFTDKASMSAWKAVEAAHR